MSASTVIPPNTALTCIAIPTFAGIAERDGVRVNLAGGDDHNIGQSAVDINANGRWGVLKKCLPNLGLDPVVEGYVKAVVGILAGVTAVGGGRALVLLVLYYVDTAT